MDKQRKARWRDNGRKKAARTRVEEASEIDSKARVLLVLPAAAAAASAAAAGLSKGQVDEANEAS